MIGEEFAEELEGHVVDVAPAIGYHKDGEDYNHVNQKARLALDEVAVTTLLKNQQIKLHQFYLARLSSGLFYARAF